ncbi:ATP-NAD kinase-like domain-containing protein [Biscogniauxia mediterranea]|nr:ATP-NAD kinase-like domain-containing protein [Biscogniauxia mediterranea]
MAADNGNANSFLIGSVKSEEVVCILKRPQAPSTYDIFSLKEVSDEQGTSFILSQTPTAEAPAQVFDGLVIDSLPAHLHSSPSQYVHVVVSALSGTGLAQKFYESVLTPLFAAFGLSASEASSPATLPNSYNLVLTQTATSIRDFARGLGERIRNGGVAAAQQQQHTVVLLSGDGGVVEMLNGKAPVDESSNKSSSSSRNETSLPLIALLPLGTGNALFHSLHKTVEPVPPGSPAPSALVQALRTLLLAGRAAPLPSFRVTFPPGSRTITYGGPGSTAPAPAVERKELGEKDRVVEEEGNLEEHSDAVTHLHGAIVASYGFHAQLVWESDTPAYRRHGAARFGMVAQELLREAHAYRADVELVVVPASSSSSSTTTTTAGVGLGKDNKGTEKIIIPRDRHAYLLATLVSHLERTFCISPASRPLDGRLRLVHFGPASGDRTMDIMRAAYDGGRHVGMKWGGGDGEGEEEEKGEVGYDEVEELRITVREEDPRWRKMCIDGTIVEVPAGATVTVQREGGAHLRVLVDRGVVAGGDLE